MGVLGEIKDKALKRAGRVPSHEVVGLMHESKEPGTRTAAALGMGLFQDYKYSMPPVWFWNPAFGIPRSGLDTSTMRIFGKSVWARMPIDTIIEEVCGLEWDILPKDEYQEKDTHDKERLSEVKDFFEKPNTDEDFRVFLKKYVEDILVIDGGYIIKTFAPDTYFPEPKSFIFDKNTYKSEKWTGTKEATMKRVAFRDPLALIRKILESKRKDGKKVLENKDVLTGTSPYVHFESVQDQLIEVREPTPQSRLLEMRIVDGATMLKQPDIYGRMPHDKPCFFQYSFLHPGGRPLPFYKREVVEAIMNPGSDRFYGFSPIQSCVNILESLLNATRFNKAIFDEYALPSGIVGLDGMSGPDIDAVRTEWQDKLKGHPHKLLFIGAPIDFKPLTMSATDMQWLEGQKFYMKLILALYHCNQGEIGFTDQLNKHSSEEQSDILFRKMIFPLTRLIEGKFNTEIVPEFYLDKKDVEVEFRFKVNDPDQVQKKLENFLALYNSIACTLNELRDVANLDPLPDGDKLKELMPFAGGSPFEDKEIPRRGDEPKPKPKEEEKKAIKKKFDFDIVEESEDYDDFLSRYYALTEKRILRLLTDKHFGVKSIGRKKSLASFFSFMLQYLDPENIKDGIKKIIKKTFNNGIERGEEETGQQVGFQEKFEPKVEQLVQEQIHGYVLPNGKMWFGLKGVNHDITAKIYDEVAEGIDAGETISKIRDRIKETFKGVKENRAMMIARTESNRISHEGTLTSYIQSGVPGKKVWLSHLDSRTSDICKFLNGQEVEPHHAFIGPNGEEFMYPPAHPSCRSAMYFAVEQE